MTTEADNKALIELMDKLQVRFNNLELLKTAVTHRSYLNETPSKHLISHNERLEYLGDAVLELIVTEHLFHTYPDFKEGELTSFRAATVRTTSLAETAESLKIGQYLYLSKGEERTGGRERPYILANTFEAILGAIFIDQGLDTAKDFLHRVLIPKIPSIVANRLDIDAKSKFQELSQEHFGITPTYDLVHEKGPDHSKEFKMAVKIGARIFGNGIGHNKQEAESNAALEAIANWQELLKKFNPNKRH
jgi:ribonuclease-3